MRTDTAATSALQAASTALAPSFGALVCSGDLAGAAARVTDLAEIFEVWLRRLRSSRLTLVAVEEIATGEIAPQPWKDAGVTTIDSSQRARYTFEAKDDMGYAADYALAARLKDGDPLIATIEYLNVGDPGNTSNGTDAEFDQVLATFAAFGDATVEVYDPAGDTSVVIASDPLTAKPGDVGTGTLGTAVIEEIPV